MFLGYLKYQNYLLINYNASTIKIMKQCKLWLLATLCGVVVNYCFNFNIYNPIIQLNIINYISFYSCVKYIHYYTNNDTFLLTISLEKKYLINRKWEILLKIEKIK